MPYPNEMRRRDRLVPWIAQSPAWSHWSAAITGNIMQSIRISLLLRHIVSDPGNCAMSTNDETPLGADYSHWKT